MAIATPGLWVRYPRRTSTEEKNKYEIVFTHYCKSLWIRASAKWQNWRRLYSLCQRIVNSCQFVMFTFVHWIFLFSSTCTTLLTPPSREQAGAVKRATQARSRLSWVGKNGDAALLLTVFARCRTKGDFETVPRLLPCLQTSPQINKNRQSGRWLAVGRDFYCSNFEGSMLFRIIGTSLTHYSLNVK